MDIIVETNGRYVNVSIESGFTTINLGLHDKQEAQELLAQLTYAIAEISECRDRIKREYDD